MHLVTEKHRSCQRILTILAIECGKVVDAYLNVFCYTTNNVKSNVVSCTLKIKKNTCDFLIWPFSRYKHRDQKR